MVVQQPRRPVDRPSEAFGRPIGAWAFAAVALASFGGPLALAAMAGPNTLGSGSRSAGLAMLAAAVVFCGPLALWLRWSKHIHSDGGLYAFVEAAVGRPLALVQAAVWALSYVLYLIYTTVQIVYDLLPLALPGERAYQTLLALLIPLALALLVSAGRAPALIALGVIGVGQVVLAGVLDGVTLAHLPLTGSSFSPTSAGAGPFAQAGAQTSLLYICGSLPLFLGGELKRPVRTLRRGLGGAFALSAVIVVLAVAPLAQTPALAGSAIPGMDLVGRFAGHSWASAIGVGVAVSTGGLILWEYVALTRLAHAIGGWRLRSSGALLGAVMVLAAPFSLINPQGFYATLLKPSMIALWVSQLIVFICYPVFMHRRRALGPGTWLLTAVATAFTGYGLSLVV